MRKKREVGGKVDDVAHGGRLPAVNVDGVGHAFKGVKGDADGQRDLGNGEAQPGDGVKGADQHAGIFKEAQQCQVDDNVDGDKQLGLPAPVDKPGNAEAAGIVHQNGENHEQNIDWLAPRIKNQAEKNKAQVLEFARNQVIGDEHKRQKYKNEKQAAEYHGKLPNIFFLRSTEITIILRDKGGNIKKIS